MEINTGRADCERERERERIRTQDGQTSFHSYSCFSPRLSSSGAGGRRREEGGGMI